MTPQRAFDEILGSLARTLAADETVRITEDRMRTLLGSVLDDGSVTVTPEWRPPGALTYWPNTGRSQLGGFDLGIVSRDTPAADPIMVIETKWATRRGIDALDEAPWDLFKIAHAVRSIPVPEGILVYAASDRAWNKPARFVEFFDGDTVGTRDVLADHENVWRWLLTSAKSRPTRLPAEITTQAVGRAALDVGQEPWTIRAATVTVCSDPSEWYPLTPDGWPA